MKSFYNPKQSALRLMFSPKKLSGSITIANSLQKHAKGKVQKGAKVFDWENALTFSISDEEADEIVLSLHTKNDISLQHFPTEGNVKGVSYLHVRILDYTSNNHPKRLNVTINRKIGNVNQSVTYTTLSLYQTRSFIKFLKFVSELPYWAEMAAVFGFNWPK